MKRRQFLNRSIASAILLPAALGHACHTPLPAESSSTAVAGDTDDFPLNELSIDELQEKMRSGEYTCRALVELYLDRIEKIDRREIQLNSVIELNPDALRIADQLDKERKNGKLRGPLHGIPVLVKDNIDTGDRMMTTAGSLALVGNYAPQDAPIIAQLRSVGAVLLGKTNLSEWANFRSDRSSSGWSSRGGQTKNPYSLERNPCGSSSGSGVAVAANLCAFAVGTETNGSINCPASINGIVGLKPTVGLVSRRGIIPISRTQDTAGPMTRTVRDAAIALNALCGADVQDEAMRARPQNLPSDYLAFLNAAGLQGKRIGVEKSFLKVHEEVDVLLQQALAQMRAQGATIVEVDFKNRLESIKDNEYKVLQYEFKDGLNRYLAGTKGQIKTLGQVIQYNSEHAETVMPFFEQEILEGSNRTGNLDEEDYKRAVDLVINTSRKAIDNTLSEQNLHAICGPATGPAWCTDLVNGDSFSGYGMGSGAAMAGYPSITVPMGEVHGLPVGLLFMASGFSEAQLLTIGYAYEQASRNRRSPGFRKSLL